MPLEFYQGRPLEPEEMEAIRQQIEQFDTIEAIDQRECATCRAVLTRQDSQT